MTLAITLTLIGLALVVAGVAMIFPPAAFIVGGGGLIAVGLFGIDADKPKGNR